MLDDNITQTLAIIIPMLAGMLGMFYFWSKQLNAVEDRLNRRIDGVEDRLDKRIDRVERNTREEFGRVHEEFGRVHEDLARVREDLAEVKGKVDLMAAIVTKSENERMAEAIIALETRRASAQSE